MNRFVAFFVPVVIILAAAALYTPYANRIMYCDEANTLYQYARDPARSLLSYATPNNHILHSIQVWAITLLAGTSAPVVRFPALAAGLIALALAYRAGRRLAGRNAGLIAAALLATTYGFADYAINARGYTLAVALTLGMIDLVWATPASRFRRRVYAYSLIGVCAALILTLPSMILVTAGAGLYALWKQQTDSRYRLLIAPMIVGTGVGSIVYLPSLFSGLVGSHLGMFGETDLGVMLRDLGVLLFGTPWVGMVFAVAIVVGVVAIMYPSPPDPLSHAPRVDTADRGADVWGRRADAQRGVPTNAPVEDGGRRANFVRLWRPYGGAGSGAVGTAALVVIGVMVAAILFQFVFTHRILFARNYFYAVAPLALIGGVGGAWLLRRGALLGVALALIAAIPGFRPLDGDYLEKAVVSMVDANLRDTDWLIPGPCFMAPIQHHLEQTGRDTLLYNRPGVDRALLLLREGTVEENLAYFGAEAIASTCQPFSEPIYGEVMTFTCTPSEISP